MENPAAGVQIMEMLSCSEVSKRAAGNPGKTMEGQISGATNRKEKLYYTEFKVHSKAGDRETLPVLNF